MNSESRIGGQGQPGEGFVTGLYEIELGTMKGQKLNLITVEHFNSLPPDTELVTVMGGKFVVGRDKTSLITHGGYLPLGFPAQEVIE